MTDKKFDITGIGNACMDIVADCDMDFLDRNEIKKSHCIYVDAKELDAIISTIPNIKIVPGGSAANTIHCVRAMGGRSAFLGKIGDDQTGKDFYNAMTAENIHCALSISKSLPSTRVLCINTPDGDRSFVSLKGAAETLSKGDIDYSLIDNSSVFLFDGYTLYSPFAHAAFNDVIQTVRKNECLLAFNPGNLSVIDMRPDQARDVMDQADVPVCNLSEIGRIYGFATLEEAASLADKKVAGSITNAEHGAVTFYNGNVHFLKPDDVLRENIDTNGAGDHFAAGFLYGLTHGFTLPQMTKLAELCALDCLSHAGGRPLGSLAPLVAKALLT